MTETVDIDLCIFDGNKDLIAEESKPNSRAMESPFTVGLKEFNFDIECAFRLFLYVCVVVLFV